MVLGHFLLIFLAFFFPLSISVCLPLLLLHLGVLLRLVFGVFIQSIYIYVCVASRIRVWAWACVWVWSFVLVLLVVVVLLYLENAI